MERQPRRQRTPPRATLGAAIGRVVRRRRGDVPQQELGDRAGTTVVNVSRIEHGQTPRLGVLEGMARALGTRPSTLLREAEDLQVQEAKEKGAEPPWPDETSPPDTPAGESNERSV
ncbi:MAG TPA: helix-turn-helix transcriptional regulator [Candidatus Angelobacter sp.]|nr:helix-turn-helix transcriptional regulator [Candidatus Angelobacter sp.]